MAGLKFRVLLDTDSDNEIFRDILIDDQDNFESFYKSIIKSFNFGGNEMASFYVSNDSWDKGFEISLMDLSYDDDAVDAPSSIMKDAIIKNYLEEPDQKYILVYDFMRMWIFYIELVEVKKDKPSTIYPRVALAFGDAPSQDSKEFQDMFEADVVGGGAADLDDVDDDEDEFGEDDDIFDEDEFDGSYTYDNE